MMLAPDDVALAPDVHVDAHEQGDGHGGEDGEGAPGAVEQGVHHADGKPGQGEDEDEEDGEGGHGPGALADLLLGDVGQALALVAHRGEQHHHVVHGAAQDAADDDPEGPGQPPELRGQHRPEQGPGGGDGGEMVAEEHEPVGLVVVVAVGQGHGRGGAVRVEVQDLPGQEDPVVPVGQGEHAQRHEHKRKGIR